MTVARTPGPGWRSDRVSQGYVADYKPFVMVDGEGVRCSLYVSGCLFACEGCFNEAAWSFRYGRPYSHALADRALAHLAHPAVQRLSLPGAAPSLNPRLGLRPVRPPPAAHDVFAHPSCLTGSSSLEQRAGS